MVCANFMAAAADPLIFPPYGIPVIPAYFFVVSSLAAFCSAAIAFSIVCAVFCAIAVSVASVGALVHSGSPSTRLGP